MRVGVLNAKEGGQWYPTWPSVPGWLVSCKRPLRVTESYNPEVIIQNHIHDYLYLSRPRGEDRGRGMLGQVLQSKSDVIAFEKPRGLQGFRNQWNHITSHHTEPELGYPHPLAQWPQQRHVVNDGAHIWSRDFSCLAAEVRLSLIQTISKFSGQVKLLYLFLLWPVDSWLIH